MSASGNVLSELRERIAHLEMGAGVSVACGPAGQERTHRTLAFGVEALDAHLPDEGLRLGALHEVADADLAGEYAANAVLFVGGILARLSGPVLWCLSQRDLFAPALSRIGLHPDRVVYCETGRDGDVLPAMEEGLRCTGLAGVVGEVGRLSLTASRRLQLAAEAGQVTAFAIRRWRHREQRRFESEPGAAMTRWRLSSLPTVIPVSETGGAAPGLIRSRWKVELVRCRGGEPASWHLESCDAQGRLSLPASLADRPDTPAQRRAVA